MRRPARRRADAHGRVFSGTLQTGPDALDVIATALSAHLAVYGFRDMDSRLTELTEDDYSKGAFRRGATRFDYREGNVAFILLAVRQIDFEQVLHGLMPPRGDPKRPAAH